MTTINSITKKDGEVLTVGDVTNKGKIKFFRDYMGDDCWVAVEEQPQQFKVDDVSKKGVGDGFVWTDELVSEFCFDNGTSYRGPDNDIKTHIEIGIEKFKKSKQSTPTKEENKEIIEVDVFQTNGTDCMNGMLAYTYTVSQKIPQEKFPLIKKVIEYVLNNEDKVYKDWLLSHNNQPTNQPTFTQSQMDEARRNAFEAARSLEYNGPFGGGIPDYETFDDYIKTINP